MIRQAEEICFKTCFDLTLAFLDKQIKGEVTEGVQVCDEMYKVCLLPALSLLRALQLKSRRSVILEHGIAAGLHP